MHALVVCQGEKRWSPEGHQVLGFGMYEKDLIKQLGLTFEMAQAGTLVKIEEAVLSRPCDVAFLMVPWGEDPAEVVAMFRRLSERPGRPRLIFLDYFAPASSPFLGVLPYVDCYCKRQTYRDPSMNERPFEGGNLLTDYVSKVLEIDLHGWHFGGEPDPDHLDKLVHGWNLGVSPHYRRLLKLTRSMPLPWHRRPFAVNCRLGPPPDPSARAEWYHHYRRLCLDALAPLRRDHRCTGSHRVRRRHYFAEMILSRVGFSPFGWGEVCFRDYEVIASGALLIKPSMDHLKTSPSVYVKGKTYVPVAWDLSDLDEVTRYYLAHPEESRAIIANAQAALSNYYEKGGFVADVRRVLDRAGMRSEGARLAPRRASIMV